LRRIGSKGHPAYRIVVTDRAAARGGAFVEQIGTYDPFPDPPAVRIDEEKARKWLQHGAQPSEAVARILERSGVTAKAEA